MMLWLCYLSQIILIIRMLSYAIPPVVVPGEFSLIYDIG